jgi:integrase-like protein
MHTERGGPVTRAWFLKMVRRTGELAKLPFPAHPHMLRHGCGFKLANDGVDTRALQHFLGHRNTCTRCGIPNCAPTASMGSGRTEGVRLESWRSTLVEICASAAALCATGRARTAADTNAVHDRLLQSMRVRFSDSEQWSSPLWARHPSRNRWQSPCSRRGPSQGPQGRWSQGLKC